MCDEFLGVFVMVPFDSFYKAFYIYPQKCDARRKMGKYQALLQKLMVWRKVQQRHMADTPPKIPHKAQPKNKS